MTRRRALALAAAGAALFLCAGGAGATWKPQYASAPAAVQQWYRDAVLTPAAHARLGFAGCCDGADVVKAQFRFGSADGKPAWFFLRDGAWLRIPDDIIHWDESAPDNKPTLFALREPFGAVPAGTLTCFYPPSGGY